MLVAKAPVIGKVIDVAEECDHGVPVIFLELDFFRAIFLFLALVTQSKLLVDLSIPEIGQ